MKRWWIAVLSSVIVAHAGVSHAQADRVFETETGMMLNYIKSSNTRDFEEVMRRLATALASSANPQHQAMAEGWHLLRAREAGPNNSVLYLWWIDPAVPGANYAISQILREVYPEEVEPLYQRFNRAFAGGQAMVNLDHVFHFADPDGSGRLAQRPDASGRARQPTQSFSPVGNAETLIRQHCAAEWPDDFQMRAYCEDQQAAAVTELNQAPASDIPSAAFQTIRAKCTEDWPGDFQMRAYCENQQVEGYRAVR